ncbi:MAG: hypothetical protein U0570_03070 [Phycisphaerales bacterium]
MPLTVVARVMTNNASAQNVGVRLNVVGCLGDLDGGDSVDDADLWLFAQSYNELVIPPGDPAADLNQDEVVDDIDFILFVQAYDRLLCERCVRLNDRVRSSELCRETQLRAKENRKMGRARPGGRFVGVLGRQCVVSCLVAQQ